MKVDICIVGAGIAGAGLAAHLAGRASVVLLEAEGQAGFHATGRSAAFWQESYGGPAVQPLTTASGPVLSAGGFLSARQAIHLADGEGGALLDEVMRDFPSVRLDRLDRPALEAMLPGLRAGWDRGLLEPSTADIDVGALHAHYLAQAKRAGAVLMCDAPLLEARREGGGWQVQAGNHEIACVTLVNAAGAWADAVAARSGVRPLGIRPYRRTVAQLRLAEPVPGDMPLVMDAAARFYLKPLLDGRIWLSPHDETPCDPCDAAAEELDVALAIDRMEQAFDWRVARVEHRWAGLRSFAPDRVPVYGFDAGTPGFFWCAGQGGFGIQTAPAASALAAALLLGETPEIDPAPFDPGRFAV